MPIAYHSFAFVRWQLSFVGLGNVMAVAKSLKYKSDSVKEVGFRVNNAALALCPTSAPV
jgi:hypothetical protein